MLKKIQLGLFQTKNSMIEYLKSTNKIQKTLLICSLILLITSLFIGAFSRIYGSFNYTQFQGDQARDAFVIAGMREGKFPKLGPSSSVGTHSLPPLYYYLAGLPVIFSTDPALQVLSNSVLSFFSIFLLAYFIFKLLNKEGSFEKRLLISSVAAFWWSLWYNDILLNNREWNPNSIPFFLLAFILTLSGILDNTKNKVKSFLLWALSGFLMAILMSLHSTTLFIIPILYVLFISYFLFRERDFFKPIIGFISFTITMIPYWVGEFKTGWINSKLILQTVFKSSTEPHTAIERLDRAFFNYLEMGSLAYFMNNILTYGGLFFLGAVAIFALLTFKGKKNIWVLYLLSMAIYSYAASNYWGTLHMHYKTIIWFAPIVFTAISFDYLNNLKFQKVKQISLSIFIIFFVCISIWSNFDASSLYLKEKIGKDRVLNTYDITFYLKKLPINSTLCITEGDMMAYQYLIKYEVKANINLVNQVNCQNGNYQFYQKALKGKILEGQVFYEDNLIQITTFRSLIPRGLLLIPENS